MQQIDCFHRTKLYKSIKLNQTNLNRHWSEQLTPNFQVQRFQMTLRWGKKNHNFIKTSQSNKHEHYLHFVLAISELDRKDSVLTMDCLQAKIHVTKPYRTRYQTNLHQAFIWSISIKFASSKKIISTLTTEQKPEAHIIDKLYEDGTYLRPEGIKSME